MVKLTTSEQKQDKDAMMSIVTLENQLLPLQSVMQESQATNSEMTLNDKLNSCEINTLPQNLSKTSEADSTSKEKVLKPFWNELCQELTSLLWLPTETDLQDLGSISFDKSLSQVMVNSKTLQNGGKLVVLDETFLSPEQEVATDLLNIVHVFSARMHGLRSYKKQINQIVNNSSATSDVQTLA